MLKIKKEHMKDLVDFGFIKEKTKFGNEFLALSKPSGDIIAVEDDRIIYLMVNSLTPDIPDVVYDLIQAGMVEKV